jgi:hypothetical protein
MHSIVVDSQRALIEVGLDGEIHFDERLSAFNEIVAAVEESGATRLLITYASTARIAVSRFGDSHVMASSLAHDPTLARCRIAYVTPPRVRVDPVTETLAYAKGFQGQRFQTRDAAIEWLLAA